MIKTVIGFQSHSELLEFMQRNPNLNMRIIQEDNTTKPAKTEKPSRQTFPGGATEFVWQHIKHWHQPFTSETVARSKPGGRDIQQNTISNALRSLTSKGKLKELGKDGRLVQFQVVADEGSK